MGRAVAWAMLTTTLGCAHLPDHVQRDDASTLADATVDVVDAPRLDDVTDAAVDVSVADVPDANAPSADVVDASAPVDAPVDVPIDAGAPPPDAPDAAVGPPTLRGAFVAGSVAGSAGGVVLRGVLSWHAAARGTSGGVTLEGWLR